MEDVEDNKECEVQKHEEEVAVDAAADTEAPDVEKPGDAKGEVADEPLTSDQPEAPEQPVDTVEELEQPAEIHNTE